MSTKEVSVNNNKPIAKYKVLCSERYGRYLVAGKKINAGEVIIREKPVGFGPALLTDNHLCFECLDLIPTDIDHSIIVCQICQVAVFCSVDCEVEKSYHTIEECEILANKTISFNVNDILLPLRLWLIKKKDEKLWEKMLRLQAHTEARRDGLLWKAHEEVIINTLKSLGIVDKSEENNFSEIIQRICGILDVNSIGMPVKGTSPPSTIRCLYLEASLMNHDCRGNTFEVIDEEFELKVHASIPIDEGEMILSNYTTPILGMTDRQIWLRESKYFECDCPMCEDPYELGTNLSTMFCPYCSDGLITFTSVLTKDTHVKKINWKCNRCPTFLSGDLIAVYLYLVKMRIKLSEDSIKELEILLEKLSSIFHPNHSLMMDIKTKLFALYKLEIEHSSSHKKIFKKVIEIGTDILKIREIVDPGISFPKGVIFHNIQGAILYFANLDYYTQKITIEEFLEQMEKAMEYLEKSVKILLYAPVTSYEGRLGKQALEEYQNLCRSKTICNNRGIKAKKKL